MQATLDRMPSAEDMFTKLEFEFAPNPDAESATARRESPMLSRAIGMVADQAVQTPNSTGDPNPPSMTAFNSAK